MPVMRTVLARRTHEVKTAWGPVAGKVAYVPDGSPRFTPEYEACRQIAAERGVSLIEVSNAALAAFREESEP
jgi:uncharacterized protein (DUF111 family)